MKWELKPLGEIITENRKSKLKVRDSDSEGRYIFFTSGRATSFANEALIDGENLFVATGGAANVAYHKGPASYSTDCYSITSVAGTNAKYLYYFLTRNLPKINAEMFKGAALKHLQKKMFKALQIPLPPLEEQKRIAGILDAADILRAKRREALARLDDLLQATFLDLFGDPVTNPKAYPEVPLTHLCAKEDDIRCGPFGTQLQQHEFQASGIPLWGIKHVNAGFDFETDEFVSEEKAEKLSQYSIISGDLVMTRKGTIGNCHVYPDDKELGIMHSDLLRLRLDPSKAIPQFLSSQFAYSARIRRQIELMSPGAVMPGINVSKLKKLQVEHPPLHEQQRFAEIVTSVEEQKAKMRKHLEQLDDLFASLQQRAFRGDL